jgi:hypothetical protein
MRRNSDPSRPGVLSRSAVEYPELTHYSFILLVEGSNDEIREMFRGLHPHNRLVAMRRASSSVSTLARCASSSFSRERRIDPDPRSRCASD